MQIHRGIEYTFPFEECVVTVGMFDGMHRGHRQLIGELKEKSAEMKIPSVVVTLWPHPKVVLGGNSNIKFLSTLEEKAQILESLGIDHFVVLNFTQRLASLSPSSFIREILIGKLHAKHFHMGFNHRFGSGSCSLDELESICKNEGLTCSRGSQYNSDQYGACSSSVIRDYLSNGEMKQVNELLAHPYSITGIVVHGDGIGQKIGFPTANLELDDKSKMLPADGVYAALAEFDGQVHRAVVDIGMRPTVQGKEHRVEAHLIDFFAKIYGRKMTISFFLRIREEKRFAMLEELENQIVKDIECAKAIFLS